MPKLTKLEEIARRLPGTLVGSGALEVAGLAHPDEATGDHLAVALTDDVKLGETAARAAAVRRVPEDKPEGMAFVVCEGDPRIALASLTAMFDDGPAMAPGVHARAVVAPDAVLGEGVAIGPGAVVGAGTRIGARTRILPNTTIGADVEIGADGLVHPGVVVADRVRIGDRVILHPNAVIGSDGFSFASPPPGTASADDRFPRIHALGTVEIGDDVEIGAGTTVDRATLRATVIGSGTKIDNQVQVAHNVVIGRATIVCGQAGIAGSTTIGDGVVMAAGSGTGDHVKIGDRAVLTALAAVASHVPAGEVVMGVPAVPRDRALARFADLNRLGRALRQIADLAKRVAALERTETKESGKVGETDV